MGVDEKALADTQKWADDEKEGIWEDDVRDLIERYESARAQPGRLPTRDEIARRLHDAFTQRFVGAFTYDGAGQCVRDGNLQAADYVLSLLAQRTSTEQPRAWTRELATDLARHVCREGMGTSLFEYGLRVFGSLSPVPAPEQQQPIELNNARMWRLKHQEAERGLSEARSQLAAANQACEEARRELAEYKELLCGEQDRAEAAEARHAALVKACRPVTFGTMVGLEEYELFYDQVQAALKAERPKPADGRERAYALVGREWAAAFGRDTVEITMHAPGHLNGVLVRSMGKAAETGTLLASVDALLQERSEQSKPAKAEPELHAGNDWFEQQEMLSQPEAKLPVPDCEPNADWVEKRSAPQVTPLEEMRASLRKCEEWIFSQDDRFSLR